MFWFKFTTLKSRSQICSKGYSHFKKNIYIINVLYFLDSLEYLAKVKRKIGQKNGGLKYQI